MIMFKNGAKIIRKNIKINKMIDQGKRYLNLQNLKKWDYFRSRKDVVQGKYIEAKKL